MVDRPLTLGAAGGSISAIAWRLLAESLRSTPVQVIPDCPELDCVCPDLPALSLGHLHLDLQSLLLGVLVGLSLGPLLDLLVLLRDLALRNTELWRFA